MKMFGDTKLTFTDAHGESHVIVATRGGGWQNFCWALSENYETVEPEPKPTTDPVVWNHERDMVSCKSCLAMLDGGTVVREKIK